MLASRDDLAMAGSGRLVAAATLPRPGPKGDRTIDYDLRPLLLDVSVAGRRARSWSGPGSIPSYGSGRPDEVRHSPTRWGCRLAMPGVRAARSAGIVRRRASSRAEDLLCDRPATLEQVWGRPAVAELRDRLATAAGPHEMLTVLEDELMRRLREIPGLALVRHASTVIAETSGAVAVGDLSVAAGVSGTHLVQRFKALVGVTPKRLARSYRFAATVLALDPAEPIDWADVAAGAGYFDQAHFGHEFREFTGFTPTRYVEVRRQFLRDHPGHVLDGWPLPAD